MVEGWLLIDDGDGPRRETLRPGLTRVGGRAAEVVLPSAGQDQLQFEVRSGAPPRLLHVGSGARPRVDGLQVEEADLAPGTRIEWAGATLTYLAPKERPAGAPAALETEALLELDEIDPAEMVGWEAPSAPPPPASGNKHPEPPAEEAASDSPGLREVEHRAWRRLQAGVLVELNLADKQIARAWQARVREGGFDPDRCADELLAGARTRLEPGRVLDRCGRLQRDLLMSPLLRGARGAGRTARAATKGLVAMVLAQSVALLVYSLLVAVALLLLRHQGHDPTGWLDAVLGVFGLAPAPPS